MEGRKKKNLSAFPFLTSNQLYPPNHKLSIFLPKHSQYQGTKLSLLYLLHSSFLPPRLNPKIQTFLMCLPFPSSAPPPNSCGFSVFQKNCNILFKATLNPHILKFISKYISPSTWLHTPTNFTVTSVQL